MAQNEMMKLVLVLSLILRVLIIGVAAEAEPSSTATCDTLCIIECFLKRSPVCIAECMQKCRAKKEPPIAPPPDIDIVSDCAFSCADSICINFISDANKLKGCVGSCYKNCSYDP